MPEGALGKVHKAQWGVNSLPFAYVRYGGGCRNKFLGYSEVADVAGDHITVL
jgi:hypothetical protein